MHVRLLIPFLLSGTLVAAGSSATTPTAPAVASAAAYGIAVSVPGQPAVESAPASAPGATPTGVADGFAYPADGVSARTGAQSSSASARAAAAHAVTDVLAVSLLNGEVTADSLAGRARASATGVDTDGSQVTNLVLLGQPVTATPNGRFPLGDWGYAVTLEEVAETTVSDTTRNSRASMTALRIVLTADHGGLPAGAEIVVGHAEASASTAVLPPAEPLVKKPSTSGSAKAADPPRAAPKRRQKPKSALREPRIVPGLGGPLFRTPPQNISAPLSPCGYVFPVYGDASFSDTWGAPRATTGRHQGTDIFALLGAPILAVADGTLFSVGWNRIGGWRLWLRDRQGNQFYYAHLAAYSPITRNGAEVKAGQVVGFNGNSGDAQGTPFHVHFEIHPVGMLPLGYDGVVAPYPYLIAWRRVEDVALTAGTGWAPAVAPTTKAPMPAAILLQSVDISTASGLEPGALDRAAAGLSATGGSVLLSGNEPCAECADGGP